MPTRQVVAAVIVVVEVVVAAGFLVRRCSGCSVVAAATKSAAASFAVELEKLAAVVEKWLVAGVKTAVKVEAAVVVVEWLVAVVFVARLMAEMASAACRLHLRLELSSWKKQWR